MQALIPDSQIINIATNHGHTTSMEIYKGEWIYTPLNKSASLINIIYNGSDKSDVIILGSNMSGKQGHKSMQSIRSKIALIRSNRRFPDDITVGEEIANISALKNIRVENSRYSSILKDYSISYDNICHQLSNMSKIILDIIIAIESDMSILILDSVLSLIAQPYQDHILNYIRQKTIYDGLSVIIATDNNEIKEQYLGREISLNPLTP